MNILKKVKEWIPVIIFISGVALYASVMYGIPPRVNKLEADMQEQKIKIAQSDSTLQMVAADVRDIKNMLMRQK